MGSPPLTKVKVDGRGMAGPGRFKGIPPRLWEDGPGCRPARGVRRIARSAFHTCDRELDARCVYPHPDPGPMICGIGRGPRSRPPGKEM